MKPLAKVGVVAVGYLAAFLIASAAVAVRISYTSGPEAQASSGMYAFGDLIVFVGVFGTTALVPTGFALFFLRSSRSFWKVLAVVGVGIAVTGVAAAVVFLVGRNAAPSPLATWAAFSVLRMLVAPLCALTFFLAAVLSPYRSDRSALLAATAMELAVCACAGWVWFVPLFFASP